MKFCIAVAVLFGAGFCASAQAKPCEDLKTEIARKLDAKGVTGYSLNVVDKGKEADAKVVGTCGGGTKSIVYEKAAPAGQPKPAAEKKPIYRSKS